MWRVFRENAENMFNAAVSVCDPVKLINGFFTDYDLSSFNDIYVIGFGKASAKMAEAVELNLGSKIKEGLVLSIEDRPGRIEVKQVPHPLPDDRTVILTRKVREIVKKVEQIDLLICLVSGGGSAMLSDPVPPLDKMNDAVTTLMNSGADILEMNAFRRSVSKVKGGRLGALCKGHVLNLIISDVVDGSLWDIASGPTVEDKGTYGGLEIAEKYGLLPDIIEVIDDTRPVFESESVILADNTKAVTAAFERGTELGLDVYVRSEPYTGKAEEVGRMLCEEAPEGKYYLCGGESTVEVKGSGCGGRNQHLCLNLHDELCDCFSAGTDGIDGISEAAGAFLDDNSRADDWKEYLERYDSASFFAKSNSQLITGPTGTNVCDITIIKLKEF